MKTIYVIGTESPVKAREILNILDDTEVICINSKEEIPIEARLSSDPLIIQEIFKITARPQGNCDVIKPKYRGHERPYKYHK